MKCTSGVVFALSLLFLQAGRCLAADPPPRSTDPRIKIELFAESPQIKTPTGIDVDARGRVWAIECNTHFRPENYDGHPSDRLLIMTDADGDGRCETIKTFADGFKYAMSVAVRPVWLDEVRRGTRDEGSAKDSGARVQSSEKSNPPSTLSPDRSGTQVFLATRRAIYLLEDLDGDYVCDKQTELAWLETTGDYPHNGLAGFAFDALGWMYFGFGENLGAPYVLKSREMDSGSRNQDSGNQGADAPRSPQPFTGEGEGGNIYRMRPDGTQLSHWATGFWNPHASCVDAFGRLFTVDNDPDSRPPCRLLHVIEGGDYGYRFRNGRKGLHPFTAWNGEIPGTLPMVAGTGEAPSGILAYEHDALPEDYLGRLFVTSWGDHRIDTFVLKPKGASFESVAQPLIVGGENFRPVGIALAPDGSLYCTDWVLRDYKLHGQGRVWRISPAANPVAGTDLASGGRHPPDEAGKTLTTKTRSVKERAEERLKSRVLTVRRLAAKELAQSDAGRDELKSINADSAEGRRPRAECCWALGQVFEASPVVRDPVSFVNSADPFLSTAAISQIVRDRIRVEWQSVKSPDLREDKIDTVILIRHVDPHASSFVAAALASPSALVRRVAVQWAAEENMKDLCPQVEAVLKSEPMTTDLFLATLAALEMLDGKPPADFDKTPAGKYVLPLLKDDKTPAAVKAQALRLVDPIDPALAIPLLVSLSQSEDPQLKLEAVRSLSLCNRVEGMNPLVEIVATPPASNRDPTMPIYEEAVLGLANFVQNPATSERATGALLAALTHITGSRADADLAQEIELSLKPKVDDPAVAAAIKVERTAVPASVGITPTDDGAWRKVLALPTPPDEIAGAAMRGRIAFFHPHGAGCYKCHTVLGRGGKIGPDLSRIGGTFTREKFIDSILEPSKEISPQFTNWSMVSTDGKVYTGMIVHENEGTTVLGQADGTLVTLKTADVEERTPQTTSVMPEKLEERMTVQEFRDLLAFLEALK